MRLAGFDCSTSAAYFITICALNRRSIFGRIADGEMPPSSLGQLVLADLKSLPDRYSQLALDLFILMPNHLHFNLLIYGKYSAEKLGLISEDRLDITDVPTIVGRFKAGVTRRFRQRIGKKSFAIWQRNFWDHVIRNDCELEFTREYIQTNVLSWQLDRENPKATGVKERFAGLEEGGTSAAPTSR